MITVFHIFRFLIFLIILHIGLYIGFNFYGWLGVVLSTIPSILIGAVVTNIIRSLEREATLYLMSKKSLAELEEYMESDGIGSKYLAFVELKKRNIATIQYKYIVDGLIESEIGNERLLGKTLHENLFSNEKIDNG